MNIKQESSEKNLFLAVVFQALLDATKPKVKNESSISIMDRDKAIAWFFCSAGVTCDNFEFICDNANLDSNSVRGFAYEVINSKQKPNFRYKIYQILSDNK